MDTIRPDAGLLSAGVSRQEDSLVRLANSILSQLHVSQKLRNYSQINGSLFVTMYEGLCGELLADVIRTPRCLDDDIHNAQTVIDALSLEVLHTSLSHIAGDAIAKGDRTAVGNLLDLFSSLMEFILNRIECDLSSDGEDYYKDNKDPNRLTSEIVDEILSRDIGEGTSLDDNENDIFVRNQEDRLSPYDQEGRESPLEGFGRLSPYEPMNGKISPFDNSQRRSSPLDGSHFNQHHNSTAELIRESEAVEQRLRDEEVRHKLAAEDARQRADEARQKKAETRLKSDMSERLRREERLLVEQAMRRYGEDPRVGAGNSDSDSAPYDTSKYDTGGNLADTESPLNLTPSKRDQFSSLLSLTEQTSELARSAVENSPARARAERSAFLEAAIKSALKKIDREAKGVETLVKDIPKKKCVRLKLSDEFNVEMPRKSPMRATKPKHPHELCKNNNAGISDDDLSTPAITITNTSGQKIKPIVKKSARVRPLQKENATAHDKSDHLKRLYAFDYKNYVEDHKEVSSKSGTRANAVEKSMRQTLTKSSRKSRPPLNVDETKLNGRRKSASTSPPKRRYREDNQQYDYIEDILESFPAIYLSTDTIHDLWRQSVKQVEQLNKIEQDTRRKDQLHKQLEEATRRQNLVSDIFRKDMDHRRRMTDIKERDAQKRSVKLGLQEKRAQSARIRRYYQEFQLGLRSKMLNKRVRDELVFKRVFKDGLAIQRQSIREMRKYAKDQRTKKSKIQQDEIESLENFYRDQFLLLAENTSRERSDVANREKAQSRVIDRMKRELRCKMEQEVRTIQSQLCEDDDGHFRQLDADRLHQDLLLAKYKSYI